MDLDTFKPTFLIEIEGLSLSKGGSATRNVAQKIEVFSFTDSVEEMDELELRVLLTFSRTGTVLRIPSVEHVQMRVQG